MTAEWTVTVTVTADNYNEILEWVEWLESNHPHGPERVDVKRKQCAR